MIYQNYFIPKLFRIRQNVFWYKIILVYYNLINFFRLNNKNISKKLFRKKIFSGTDDMGFYVGVFLG